MKHILGMIVRIIHILSICSLVLLWILSVVYEIVGHAKFELILSAIGISNGFKWTWIAIAIAVALFVLTFFIKKKYTKCAP